MTAEQLQLLLDKILATGKINKEDLDKKIKDKLESLGGLVSEEGAAHIIANELGVQLGSAPSETIKLKDVLSGMRNVSVLGKVVRKYELRSFGEDGKGKVGNLLMADDTKTMRLTFWNDKTDLFTKIEEGDVIEVLGAYSRENNRGFVELHMGNSSQCTINPEGKTVEVKDYNAQRESETKRIDEIKDDDTFINITATIVEAYDPRFFPNCPVCNKRVKQEGDTFTCAEHGEQEPVYNYVMNIFLDDGTSNIRAALWKEQIQQLLGKTDEEVLKLRDDQDAMEETKTGLLGRIISARARVKVNETYNNKELVLYGVNPNPQPTTSPGTPQWATEKKPSVEAPAKDTPKTTKPEGPTLEHEDEEEDDEEISQPEKPTTTPSDSGIEEELVGEDDEELLSIEDLEKDL